MTLKMLFGALPVGLAVVLLAPLSRPIVPDVHSQLLAIGKSLLANPAPSGEKLDAIGVHVRTLCRDGKALPRCEKWALEVTDKFGLDEPAERFVAVAAILNLLRDLRSELPGPGTEDSATVTCYYGEAEYRLQNFPQAAESLEKASTSLEKLRGPDDPRNAECLGALAEVYFTQGSDVPAERLLLHVLDISKTSHTDSLPIANAWNDLGELYEARGNYKEAESAQLHALEMRRKLARPDDPLIAASLSNTGELYGTMGESHKAMDAFLQALAIVDRSKPDSGIAAALHNNLGDLYQTWGDFPQAELHYRRAWELMEKLSGRDSTSSAIAMGNLASLFAEEGAFQKAEPLRLKSLEIDKNAWGMSSPDTAQDFNNLGAFYYRKGDYKKAEEPYRTALQIREKILPEGHPDIAASLDNLGLDLISLGAYAEAEAVCQRALSIREKALPADHPLFANSFQNLGRVYFYQGDYRKGESYLHRSLTIRETVLPAGHPDTVFDRMDYARDLWQLGRRADARDQLIAANEVLPGFWSHTLLAIEEQRRRSLAHEFDDLLSLSISMAAGLSPQDPRGAANLAAMAISARKGIRSSAGQEIFARIRRDRNPKNLALLQHLRENAEQQENLSKEGGPDASVKLQKVREEEGEVERSLIASSTGYREWRTAVSPAQVSAALPPDAAFLDVIRYPQFDTKTGKTQSVQYAAIVYLPKSEPQFVSLGPADPIEKVARGLRSNFENMWHIESGGRRVLISGEQYQANLNHTEADASSLYTLTMAKLLHSIGGARRLIVSPDGALAEIPWEILRDANQGQYLVEEGYRISYVDSTRSIIYPPARIEPRSPAVVIAQVDYDGKRKAPVLQADAEASAWPAAEVPAGGAMGPWPPLNGGGEILQILRDLNRGDKISRVDKLRFGSKEEVMALQQPAALIVHTHGFFQAGAQAADEGLDSGIVLYGANRALDPGHKGSDGLLTAKEAMLLNLDGTRLVALLGCDTGRGAEAGEGVQGLRHALSVAGARSTLLTLWEVGDLSSAQFLKELLVRSVPSSHNTVGQALAGTQLAFLRGEIREPGSTAGSNRWRHPYFWAAETLSGQDDMLNLAVK